MLLLALALACSGPALEDEVRLAEDLTRTWIGPTTFANRLSDWRLSDGRIECVEAGAAAPVRTLALLDRRVRPSFAGQGPFTLTVRTGPIEPDAAAEPRAEQWTGFLIGTGGAHVEIRTSALTHLRPAEDGGLLCVLTGAGELAFRDFSRPIPGGGLWSLRGPLDVERVPALPLVEARGRVTAASFLRGVTLKLDGRPDSADTWRLTLAVLDERGSRLAEAVAELVPRDLVEGSTALVSHLGLEGGRRGHWFDRWSTTGLTVSGEAFGPVLATQYTLSNGDLRLTAQFPPLGRDDDWEAELRVSPTFRPGAGPPVHVAGDWSRRLTTAIEPDSFTATFTLPDLDELSAVSPGADAHYPIDGFRYWVVWDGEPNHMYGGKIPLEPAADEPFVLAAFTGHKCYTGGLQWNANGLWFPHADIVRAVLHHDPDLLFFSGDQIYEGDLTPAVTAPDEAALLDYHYKWQRWCWAFRDLTRDRPTITIPDDHDVYHGNIWGAGNEPAPRDERELSAQDRGGYKMSPRFVNAVHRTQVGHLPDPADPEPLPGGITTYHTAVEYGGVSFAVLADRMFKSSPSVVVPAGDFQNGWPQVEDFDSVRDSDVPGARLLGERQLAFLERWAEDWSGDTWMKVCLSQTIFANVATLPAGAANGSVLPGLPIPSPGEYPAGYAVAADADSNGWPKSGRDRALRALRKGFALHVAGDQHLASTIQYGIESWRDAAFALCVPSIANTWPRRWFPAEPGRNRDEGAPDYTGDFEDGFGNKLTVHAVANPFATGVEPARLHDRAPGYGIVQLEPATRTFELACWPRWVDPRDPEARPYEGWPVSGTQAACGGLAGPGGWWLPAVELERPDDAVVRVVDETGACVSAVRAAGAAFRARVPGPGSYDVDVTDPETGERIERFEGLEATRRD